MLFYAIGSIMIGYQYGAYLGWAIFLIALGLDLAGSFNHILFGKKKD
jgi:CDP-diglyceride synthetase